MTDSKKHEESKDVEKQVAPEDAELEPEVSEGSDQGVEDEVLEEESSSAEAEDSEAEDSEAEDSQASSPESEDEEGEDAEDALEVDAEEDGDEEPSELERARAEADEEIASLKEALAEQEQALAEAQKELEETRQERDEFNNRMLRIAADLENYRRRSERDKEDLRRYGIDKVVLELIPAVDDMERALAHAAERDEDSSMVEGVKMVYRKIVNSLKKFGVEGFESKGEPFDPQRHEAIQQVETTEADTGTIIEEYQKGYFLHDRLLRPALVVVAKRVDPPEEVAPAEEEISEVAVEGSADEGVEDEGVEDEAVARDDESGEPAEPDALGSTEGRSPEAE